jgi:hypothetical protein
LANFGEEICSVSSVGTGLDPHGISQTVAFKDLSLYDAAGRDGVPSQESTRVITYFLDTPISVDSPL